MITLKRATPDAVRYACLNFHYAKAVPQASYAYNIYNDDHDWCGVIIFGTGATPNIARCVGLNTGEVVELVRVALNGRQQTTSQCVAQSLKRLHRDAPHIKAVVSYADPEQGHIGTIYQATNWLYVGTTEEYQKSHRATAYVIFGKRMHPKTVYSHGWKQSEKWLRENVDPNAYELYEKPKLKYLFCFDKRIRAYWKAKARPYPKKDQSKGVD